MGRSEPQPRTGLIVALATLGIYLIWPTREFYWDGVGFSLAIESPPVSPDSLLFPNHLLYNLVGYFAWKALAATGMAVRALFVLQALNSLFAAASVYLVWRIAAAFTQSARISAWSALLFSFASQWWRFSTDANAYIPSIFFLLLSFRLLLPGLRPRPFAVAMAHGAAMLFHQLGLFFFPVAVVGLICQLRRPEGESTKRSGLIAAGKYAATAVGATSAAYLFAFALVRSRIGGLGFWHWITMRSGDAIFWLNPVHGLRYSLRGTMRLFFGGRVNRLEADWVTAAGALAFAAMLVLVVRFFVRYRRSAPGSVSGHAPEGFREWLAANRLTLVWILSYFGFLFFWQPQNTFYRLFYLPPLIFLLATSPVWRAHRIQLLALLAGIVCTWNFTVAIYPNARMSANEVLTFALQHHKDWPPGTAILYANSHSDLWLIHYFNLQATWIEMPRTDPYLLESRRSEAEQKGHTLWLEGTAYDALAADPGGHAWLEQHVDSANSFFFTTPPHRIRYYRVR